MHAVCIKRKVLQLIPTIFKYESKRGSPATAVLFQGAVASGMIIIGLDFEYLVEMATLINCITLALEFTAFLKLRYSEPETRRPYKVPGGIKVAWGITILKLCVVSLIFVFAAFQMRLVGRPALAEVTAC